MSDLSVTRHGVKLDRLVMGTWADLRDRSWEKVVWHKVTAFREAGLQFFVESCPRQAEAISRETGRPVICPGVGRVFGVV